MWSPSYLFYVVCPRNAKFLDYFPAMLCGDLARERLRIDPEGKTPENPPMIEVTGLTCRPIASAGALLGATEETIASVTLRDPESGLVVGTAICIGIPSASSVPDRSGRRVPASTPRRPWQRPASGVPSVEISASYIGERAAWAGASKPQRSLRGRPQSTRHAVATWRN
jgi:hypothetical protein